jgi:hypothetical protein
MNKAEMFSGKRYSNVLHEAYSENFNLLRKYFLDIEHDICRQNTSENIRQKHNVNEKKVCKKGTSALIIN